MDIYSIKNEVVRQCTYGGCMKNNLFTKVILLLPVFVLFSCAKSFKHGGIFPW